MKELMQGCGSGRVREFALFGETTGETDEFGLPRPLPLGRRLPRRSDFEFSARATGVNQPPRQSNTVRGRPAAYGSIVTGVPTFTLSYINFAISAGSRTQPCEAA